MIRQKNGKWVVELYDPRARKKIYVRPSDYGMAAPKNEREARRLEAKALLRDGSVTGDTCDGFALRWTVEFPRDEATNRHNAERVTVFAKDFAGRKLDSVSRQEARAWARQNPSRLAAVRAMFSDAVEDGYATRNPFKGLGLKQSRGRRDVVVLKEDDIDRLAEIAQEVYGDWGRELGAMIVWAAYTCMRPGEIFAAKWSNLRSEKSYYVGEQWHSKLGRETAPKHGSKGLIYVPARAHAAVRSMPRRVLGGERDDLMFRTPRGVRFRQTTLHYYWQRVRDSFGRPDLDFYELRHFGASYMLNVLGLEAWVVAEQLRHTDGGRLVTTLYGHPSREAALARIDAAYGDTVRSLRPVSGEVSGEQAV